MRPTSRLLVTAALVLLVLAAFEMVKQSLWPGLAPSTSQLLTVLFSAVVAVVVAWELLRRQDALARERAVAVTARQRAEALQARFAAILDATPDVVASIDAVGEVQYLNRAGRRLLGLDDTDTLSGVSADGDRLGWTTELIQAAVPAAIRDGAWAGETVLTDADARQITALRVLIAHPAPDGLGYIFTTIDRDVGDLRAAERALGETRRQLQALFEDTVAVIASRVGERPPDASGQVGGDEGIVLDVTERHQAVAEPQPALEALRQASAEREEAVEALRQAREEASQRQEVIRAAHEMAQGINRALQPPIGVLEVVKAQAALPPHLRQMADTAAESLIQAARYVRHFLQAEQVELPARRVGAAADRARATPSDERSDFGTAPARAASRPEGE